MNLSNYLKLLRIKDWRGYFLIATFGFIISKGFLFPLWEIVIFYTIIFLCFGFGFSINECFDTKEDGLDKRKQNPLVSQNLHFKEGVKYSILLGVLALYLSTLFERKVFWLCLLGILMGFFYSFPPLRFKSRPFLDLISHGLFAGAFIFLLPNFIFSQKLTFFQYSIAFSLFYFSMMLELRNHIEDYQTDKKAGLNTTACVLGYQRSLALLRNLTAFYPLTLFLIFFQTSFSYLLIFSILTLVFLFLFFKKRDYLIVRNYRILDFYANISCGLIIIATLPNLPA